MRKLLIPMMLLAVVLTFQSCKKDWVCTCDVTTHLGAGGGDYNQKINTSIDNATQADAQKKCTDVICAPADNPPYATLNSATIH